MAVMTAKGIKTEDKEMRTVFAEVMDELAEKDERVIYFDADLMNSIGMTGFSKKYPDRTFNCGIQEANMIGTAAGTSAVGMIPFVHTFGCFANETGSGSGVRFRSLCETEYPNYRKRPRDHCRFQRRHAYAPGGHGSHAGNT